MSFWLGILGSICILVAWVFEVIEGLREHKTLVDLRFAAIYFLGIVMLTAYSFAIGDPVFIALNSLIMLIVVFEIVFTLFVARSAPKGKK